MVRREDTRRRRVAAVREVIRAAVAEIGERVSKDV